MLYPPPLLGELAWSEPAEMVTWSECTNQDMRRPGLEPIKWPAHAWEIRTFAETRETTTPSLGMNYMKNGSQ